MNNSLEQQNEMSTSTSHVLINSGYGDNVSLRLENRRFTYKELEKITNKFKRVLGRGGFGYVYHGFLEDGTEVAVKLRSESSSQGAKEFLIEVESFHYINDLATYMEILLRKKNPTRE